VPLLKKGSVLGSDVSGECYRVTSGRIAESGFGEIYRGSLLDSRRDPCARRRHQGPHTCAGVARRGPFFGRLLEDQHRVVERIDAFQMVSGSGAARFTRYLLVFEWMEDGTVWISFRTARDRYRIRLLRRLGCYIPLVACWPMCCAIGAANCTERSNRSLKTRVLSRSVTESGH
jgi:hypothetical protein